MATEEFDFAKEAEWFGRLLSRPLNRKLELDLLSHHNAVAYTLKKQLYRGDVPFDVYIEVLAIAMLRENARLKLRLAQQAANGPPFRNMNGGPS